MEFRYQKVHDKGRPVHEPEDSFRIRHPSMNLAQRAKLFQPFDALQGFAERIRDSEVRYVQKGQQDQERDRSIEMCTRYYVELSPELRPYIEAASRSRLKESMVTKLGRAFKFSGEIRPTDIAAVIAPGPGGEKSAYPMAWGYHVPGIDHPIVNARSESVGEKKTFSGDWRKHRCIIPASYYFEWDHIRKPDGSKQIGSRYAIQPAGSNVTYLAGLYRIEEREEFRYPVFTVLTREPSEKLRRIHDRMPLILPEELIESWICPDSEPESIAEQAITDMICEPA